MKHLILIALLSPVISIAQTTADPCEQLGKPIKEEIRQMIYSDNPQIAKARELGARWATVVLGCKMALLNAAVAASQAAAISRALASEVKK